MKPTMREHGTSTVVHGVRGGPTRTWACHDTSGHGARGTQWWGTLLFRLPRAPRAGVRAGGLTASALPGERAASDPFARYTRGSAVEAAFSTRARATLPEAS